MSNVFSVDGTNWGHSIPLLVVIPVNIKRELADVHRQFIQKELGIVCSL